MATNMPTVQQIVAKWSQNTQAATQAYKDGVNRVTQAPGALAAQAKQKYLNGVMQNVDKWAANVAAVSLQQWQTQAVNKGATNLAVGVQNATAKTTAFWTKFAPTLAQAKAQVGQMPTDTYEQRKAKSTAMMDLLHQFSNKM